MVEDFDLAKQIAKNGNVQVPKNGLVLYSISFLNVQKNKQKAYDYVKENPGKILAEDTLCGRELKKLMAKGTIADAGFWEEQWKTALLRVIAAAAGDVTIFADNADIRGKLLDIGIKAILANDEILTINKIDKFDFVTEKIDWSPQELTSRNWLWNTGKIHHNMVS